MKQTKRKAFSFLRSYFDVLNKLDEKDKLEFLLAVINKQFLDQDPKKLGYMADFAYESQRHQIEESVKGYKSKTKDPMQGGTHTPTEGACQGGTHTPYLQEEEKEEEKEKEKGKGKEEEKGKLKRARVKIHLVSWEEFYQYAQTFEIYDPAKDFALKAKYDTWSDDGWKNGHGKKITNWKNTLRNTYLHLKSSSNGKLTFAEQQQQRASQVYKALDQIDTSDI